MIAGHTLVLKSDGINNRIRGISIHNKKYSSYMDAAKAYLRNRAKESLFNLILCQW